MSNVQDERGQEDHAPELTVTDARQGRRGRHAAWVLGVSMALVVAGFTGLWLANAPHNAHDATQPTVSSKTVAKGFEVPPPQPHPAESAGQAKPGVGSDGRGL